MCPLHRPLQVKFDNEQSDLIHKQDSSRSSSVTSSSSRPTSATRMREVELRQTRLPPSLAQNLRIKGKTNENLESSF